MRLLPKEDWIGWTPYAWLIWLAPFLLDSIGSQSPRRWVLTIAGAAVFLVLYFRGYWESGRRLIALSLAIALLGILYFPFNPGACAFFIYAGAFLGNVLSRRRALLWIAGVTAVAAAMGLLIPFRAGWIAAWAAAMVFTPLIGGINVHFTALGRRNARLKLAQEEVEKLAKLDERERIARDLHDLLGHSLSLVTLKSQLAGRLLDSDPERAAAEISEVERIAREATGEVRRAVRGFRAQKLGAELARARLALEAAGVVVEVRSGPFDLSPEEESAVALALREGVTNVVRHARANRCSVTIDTSPGAFLLEIEDDGRGVRAPRGNGISGMDERVGALGGTVELEPGSPRGTVLRVILPRPTARAGDRSALAGGS